MCTDPCSLFGARHHAGTLSNCRPRRDRCGEAVELYRIQEKERHSTGPEGHFSSSRLVCTGRYLAGGRCLMIGDACSVLSVVYTRARITTGDPSFSPVPGVLRIVCKLSGVAVHTSLYVLCTQIPVRIGFFPRPPGCHHPGANRARGCKGRDRRRRSGRPPSPSTRGGPGASWKGCIDATAIPVDISLPAAYQDTKYGTFIRIACEKIRQRRSDLDGNLGCGLRRTGASVF
jgi:hypothetical protein